MIYLCIRILSCLFTFYLLMFVLLTIAGPLAENTHPQIKDKIEEMLISKESFEPQKAKEVMDSTWTDTPEDMAIKLTANVPLLFQRLKNEGVKVNFIALVLKI